MAIITLIIVATKSYDIDSLMYASYFFKILYIKSVYILSKIGGIHQRIDVTRFRGNYNSSYYRHNK